MSLTFFSPAGKPANETERQEAVDRFRALRSSMQSELDDLTLSAMNKLRVPITTISVIDREAQWFASVQGLQNSVVTRAVSFCAHTILSPGQPLVISDTLADARFAGNPLVTGSPTIRYYAGMPIVDAGGYALGALCAIDITAERQEVDLTELGQLARQAEQIMRKSR